MKKITAGILSLLLCTGFLFAQEKTFNASFRNWITTDLVYLVDVAPLAESGVNFAPVTGPYDAFKGRATVWSECNVALPGNNGLTTGNNVKFQEGIEITPVSIVSKTKVVWTPIAFLNLSAGFNVGTGFAYGPFHGSMAALGSFGTTDGGKTITEEYETLTPFVHLYVEPWVEGLFQFDLAAVLPEDKKEWTHAVLQATYKIAHSAITGQEDGTVWEWQLTPQRFNGWNYDSVITLGYMFPDKIKPLSLAGVQTEISGYYNVIPKAGDWANTLKDFDPNFMTVSISPTLLFDFNEHHTLGMQVRFINRLSYEQTVPGITNTTCSGKVNGVEWIFDRIALSYTYNF